GVLALARGRLLSLRKRRHGARGGELPAVGARGGPRLDPSRDLPGLRAPKPRDQLGFVGTARPYDVVTIAGSPITILLHSNSQAPQPTQASKLTWTGRVGRRPSGDGKSAPWRLSAPGGSQSLTNSMASVGQTRTHSL